MCGAPHKIVVNAGELKYFHEVVALIAIMIVTYVVSSYYDLLESIVQFAHEHEHWQLDEIITVFIVLTVVLTIYAVKQWRKLDFVNRVISQKNMELQIAFGEIKQLKGMLPICSSCKRIRDDDGFWHQVESYLLSHSQAEFSHAICPECMKKLYPEFLEYVEDKSSN